ncbi:hypothetical protein ADU59_11825 [Pararhizobium polonicum]|uniref:Uncharacterized protein n=1 Tax=Pararhizobium polonicum TaxID=1612624 RepID=A0A1C7P1X4_9HYPH|nr:hypothetical protein ADU59_11825 [Pararhizobium polonicum]
MSGIPDARQRLMHGSLPAVFVAFDRGFVYGRYMQSVPQGTPDAHRMDLRRDAVLAVATTGQSAAELQGDMDDG